MRTSCHICIAIIVGAAGCNQGPGAIRPPKVNASAAAAAAIKQYDRNGDGKLAKDEWRTSPALAAVASQYDQNGDGELTSEEIAAGIAAWRQTGIGARTVPFEVRLNGQPLSGATVRLEPAPFLGGGVKEASGETSAGGNGQFNMKPEDRPKNAPNMPLMQPGLYHVLITHPSIKIPPKYNIDTTLGIEITSSNPGPEGVKWSLSSK
ncbi:MAG TPA: hypothetical protein VHU84_05795 [Lacipirellulaceae bacterium]|jgi:hypothetical protein|nr:hypothetical protein [Lacipirellulaceae bacterium]